MSLPWTENWEKTYKITLGTREYTKTLYTQEEMDLVPETLRKPKQSEDTITIPSNAVTLSNLVSEDYDRRGHHWELDTTQKLSSSSSGNENSKFKIYNPNDELVDIIMQDRCTLIVELGYQQKVMPAYSGDVIEVEPEDKGGDQVYTLYLKSGALDMRDTSVSLYYDEKTSEGDIIRDLATRFPATALGTYGLNAQDGQYKSGGRGFTGRLITNFDKIMARNNLDYVHMNGKIIITPFRLIGEDYDHFARTNYNLPSTTIKRIQDSNKRTSESSQDLKSKTRELTITCQYIPIEIGQFITIPSEIERYAGTYQVSGRRLVASTKPNGAFDVVLKVREIA
ncbi:hypothetical protein KUA24_43 [Vibrio phage HNL01]|nr:hypothetical protein KUA24_43 [Vibrio phage HNL01]